MKYKVHKLNVKNSIDREDLEQFLNNLDGEVVSVIPGIKKMSFAQIYGLTSRVDYLFIVEKINN